MKKYKIYIVGILALAAGLFIGYLIFSTKNTNETAVNSHHEQQSEEQIWTCSMHPQIRQPESGDCPICGMELIPATTGNENSNEFGFQMTEEAVKLANIQTTIVKETSSEGGASLHLNGKIQADETKAASLVTHIPGRIEKLYISFTGEQVKKKQKIATIYSPELITAQKELIESQKIVDISPGLLLAAKNKLKYWKISNQVINDILETGVIRETFDIYADFSGVVSQRKVAVGAYLKKGGILFDVQNLNSLWAIFDVYESDLSKIKLGSQILFTTPSVPNKTFKAKINFIEPVLNSKTRVVTIRAEVYNSSNRLKPEMFISGKLNITQKNKNISVPKTAVLWTGQRSVVYVKNPDVEIPSFEYREIELGESTGSEYAVTKGLNLGEEVVTNGAFVIDASSQLSNQLSMMNKKVKLKNDQHSSHLPDYTSNTPKGFKEQLSSVAKAYFSLKDALVSTDSMLAVSSSIVVLNAAEKVDMALIKGEAHIYWMEQLKAIQSHARKITELNDIEEQRKQFDFLSQALIKSIKVFGVDEDTFYVQYCPMAIDSDGATWLSEHKKILNPYFGSTMLHCGKILDTIDQSFKNAPMQEQSNVKMNLHNH